MTSAGTKPELEVVDSGMIGNCLRLLDRGLLTPPLHFQFVLGAAGGAPATPKALVQLVEMIPAGSTWSSIGIGPGHLPVVLTTLALGGHVRVGLEDNIYFDEKRTRLASNRSLVQRVVDLANELGRELSTPDETRALLGLEP
jgi:3-keto-5-aminohexanoate cleavage enzyme